MLSAKVSESNPLEKGLRLSFKPTKYPKIGSESNPLEKGLRQRESIPKHDNLNSESNPLEKGLRLEKYLALILDNNLRE